MPWLRIHRFQVNLRLSIWSFWCNLWSCYTKSKSCCHKHKIVNFKMASWHIISTFKKKISTLDILSIRQQTIIINQYYNNDVLVFSILKRHWHGLYVLKQFSISPTHIPTCAVLSSLPKKRNRREICHSLSNSHLLWHFQNNVKTAYKDHERTILFVLHNCYLNLRCEQFKISLFQLLS